MQAVGMSDEQIIQAFVRDYGPGIYLATPNAWGWIVPYASVGLGLVMIWLFVKRYRKPKALAESVRSKSTTRAREYKDQIGKGPGEARMIIAIACVVAIAVIAFCTPE